MKTRLVLTSCLCLLGAGCGASGDYPSLAPRPAEALYASGDPERVPVPAPDDPAIAQHIAPLLEAGRSGEAAFDAALRRAREAAGRAGAAGSDSWVDAQQALSRAAAARTTTTRALADLDLYAVARAKEGPLSPADAERLSAATASLQAIADRQQSQIESVEGLLRRR